MRNALYGAPIGVVAGGLMKQKIIKSLKKRCTHNGLQFQERMLNLVAHFRLQIPLLLPEIANKIMSLKVENIIHQQKTADGSDYYDKGATEI
jgi:hypothetical protein